MKIAIPLFGSVVSPRFDFAREMLIVTCRDGEVLEREKISLPSGPPLWRVALLRDIGVTVVICGGISAFSGRLLASHGVQVIPFAAGPVEEVLEEFLAGGPARARHSAHRWHRRSRGRGRSRGMRGRTPLGRHRWPPTRRLADR